jgi:NAD(P)H dehydrogenase (quinone)
MSKKVLITGATGATGSAAVRETLALGLDVRAMAHKRDERSNALEQLGAEVVVGDFAEINTIRDAMKGVDAAYFCFPMSPALISATVNFAQAAKETGVKTIINLSQRSANRESKADSCRDTYISEQVLNWSGLDVIHLRPTMFLDWVLYPWMLPFIQQGVLRAPVGKGRHSPIASSDQGRAIAALLKNPEGHVGSTIPLSGPTEMDHDQLAAELSEALGRKITYVNVPMDEFIETIEKLGFPPFNINFFRNGLADFQNGAMSGADNNVEKLTGRRAMTVGEFALAHADLINGK